MRYLKSFNESNGYYEIYHRFDNVGELGYIRDYQREGEKKVIDINPLIFNKLKDLKWNTEYNIQLTTGHSIAANANIISNVTYSGYKYNPGKQKEEYKLDIEFRIEQLIDEWFIVQLPGNPKPKSNSKPSPTPPILYKCDQWDGLIKLLTDYNLLGNQ